jgi:hypothetical protein
VISTDVARAGQTYADWLNRISWEFLHKKRNFRRRCEI